MKRIKHTTETNNLQKGNGSQPFLTDQNYNQRFSHSCKSQHASECHKHRSLYYLPVSLAQALRIFLNGTKHRITDTLDNTRQITGEYRIELLCTSILPQLCRTVATTYNHIINILVKSIQ